jgi:mono/diheme cytochrome c family protein
MVGGAVAGLLALVCLGGLGLAASGYWKLNRRHPNPVPDVAVAATPEQVARGGRLAVMCAGCHAADGEPPFEGNDFLAEPGAPPVGRFYAPNLTPTHLGARSDGEIVRAIREGVLRTGRSLVIMPGSGAPVDASDMPWSLLGQLLGEDGVPAVVLQLRERFSPPSG